MTQEDVARKIGVARTTYAMYEQNRREPDNETLQRIADFFGVSVDYILGRTDDPDPEGALFEGLDGEELQIMRELKEVANQKGLKLTSPEFVNTLKTAIDLVKMVSEYQRNQQS